MKHHKRAIKRKSSKAVAFKMPAGFEGREYLNGLGRRKTSTAQVRIYKNGKGQIIVNGLDYLKYFTTPVTRDSVKAPLVAVGQDDKVDISAMTSGGGKVGQADSVKLAISRALLILNPMFRANLKKSGFLSRDARKGPRWSKR